MDPPRFKDYYRWMLKSIICWGMPSPWLPKLSKTAWVLLLIYDFLSLMVIVLGFTLFLYSMLQGNLGFQDLAIFIPACILFSSALFLSLYQHLLRKELKIISANLDAIARDIIQSKLGHEEVFIDVYSKNSRSIINYCRTLPFLYILSSSIFFSSVPIVDWIQGNYRTNFALRISTPFDYKQPGIYEFLVIIMIGALSMSTGKLLNNDLLFLALFNTLRSCLKYLYVSMEDLQTNMPRNDGKFTRQNLRTWIKIHQDINRCLEVLLQIFSPIVIVYCVYMMFYLVFALFLQTQDQRNTIFQTFSAFIAVSVMAVQVYMIFNIADHVTFEAKDLANVIYGLPWYEMDKKMKYEVQMVLTMCNRPIHVTGYRTNSLILNRETLSAIMTSALSAYLTLCQMKDALGQKESTV